MFPWGYLEVPLRLQGKVYLRDHIVTILELGVFCFLCYYAWFKVANIGKIQQQLLGKEEYRHNSQILAETGTKTIKRVDTRDVFPMLNIHDKADNLVNMCKYFDKPVNEFDFNNNFKIYYYPDDQATEMVAFRLKRRMECILLPSDYYANRLAPFLRMDPLT